MNAKRIRNAGLYLRTSTTDQTTANQRRQLREVADRHGWNVVKVYEDAGISGGKGRDARPAFDDMLKAVARREIDLVAAWSVDRLGRSLKDLVSFLDELKAKRCDLYLHVQGLDTSTPAGQAMFQMLGVFSEFERAIIVERVNAGLARAKAEGKKLGRPARRDTPKLVTQIHKLRRAKPPMGIIAISRKLKCGVSLVQRVLSENPVTSR